MFNVGYGTKFQSAPEPRDIGNVDIISLYCGKKMQNKPSAHVERGQN